MPKATNPTSSASARMELTAFKSNAHSLKRNQVRGSRGSVAAAVDEVASW